MNGKEKIIFDKDSIRIVRQDSEEFIIHVGEECLDIEMANTVSKNGGDILEIGFGMHLSADAIQKNLNVSSHTIIEVHPKIYRSSLNWVKNKKNTNIIYGDWIDVLPKMNKKFNGILHDTHDDNNISNFLNTCKHLCKFGTIVVFFHHDGDDDILNIKKVSLKDDDVKKIPYNEYWDFKNYNLYYTFFDGENFVKKL